MKDKSTSPWSNLTKSETKFEFTTSLCVCLPLFCYIFIEHHRNVIYLLNITEMNKCYQKCSFGASSNHDEYLLYKAILSFFMFTENYSFKYKHTCITLGSRLWRNISYYYSYTQLKCKIWLYLICKAKKFGITLFSERWVKQTGWVPSRMAALNFECDLIYIF